MRNHPVYKDKFISIAFSAKRKFVGQHMYCMCTNNKTLATIKEKYGNNVNGQTGEMRIPFWNILNNLRSKTCLMHNHIE
jgi:hypothetical protein